MEDAHSSMLSEFCAITGLDDPAAAISILEATNWNLEEAVNLQFATGGDLTSVGPRAQPAGDAQQHLPEADQEVRAPMPVVRDRLYGDMGHAVPARGTRFATPDRGPLHIDVFSDFNPAAAPAPSAAGTSGPTASAAAAATTGASAGLSELFKPPAGLLFAGDFESAKAHAAQQGRWLLVNVQSPDEFATHRLNRDTWAQDLVQDMLRGTFVFWQVYNSADQGQAIIASYHLEQLPAVLIVDPVTGAKVWERSGFISSDTLIEELVPFMDAGPNDPAASALAHRSLEQAAKRRSKAAAAAAGGDSAAAGGFEGLSEADQLALAIAMSVEQQPGTAADGSQVAAGASASFDDVDEEAIWREIHQRQQEEERRQQAGAAEPSLRSQPAAPGLSAVHASPKNTAAALATPEQQPAAGSSGVDVQLLQAAAAGRVPPEPPEGAAGSCRVAFRLPDGSRLQRRFNSTDTVAALQDFVISASGAVAGMGLFHLAEARPGAAALSDTSVTIQEAGVAGAMLVLRGTQ